ncbi:PREDICTED: uncharacterized protein LOC109589546 [Amphimedon queenslandica]|uniref:Uncharacterized protein n=1 Tax=Amphimedon queenslandica TaxID=400682 RepID=A0AAN0JW73_AMPQE|nr:PREDICTED: uncharacterized protein LOC109589546 [Amphimedon queenslandica]|eukprot:XP_019861167.1 PREDICTED: uncharacterized protein LOC109589546 [Amphimedon queenslandica]
MPCIDILDKANDFESFFQFLSKHDFIGYLNYKLLKKLSQLVNDDSLDQHFVQYEKEYARLLSAASFQDFIPLFRKQSDLSPTAPLGLPYVSFRLERPWLLTSVYTWVSTFGEFSWSYYALLKELRENCIIITYAILPSVLDEATRDLKDPVILKKLENKGVTVIELPEEEEDPQIDESIEKPAKKMKVDTSPLFMQSKTASIKKAIATTSTTVDKDIANATRSHVTPGFETKVYEVEAVDASINLSINALWI